MEPHRTLEDLQAYIDSIEFPLLDLSEEALAEIDLHASFDTEVERSCEIIGSIVVPDSAFDLWPINPEHSFADQVADSTNVAERDQITEGAIDPDITNVGEHSISGNQEGTAKVEGRQTKSNAVAEVADTTATVPIKEPIPVVLSPLPVPQAKIQSKKQEPLILQPVLRSGRGKVRFSGNPTLTPPKMHANTNQDVLSTTPDASEKIDDRSAKLAAEVAEINAIFQSASSTSSDQASTTLTGRNSTERNPVSGMNGISTGVGDMFFNQAPLKGHPSLPARPMEAKAHPSLPPRPNVPPKWSPRVSTPISQPPGMKATRPHHTSHDTPPSFGAPPGAHYSRNPWQYSSLLKGREDKTSSSSSPQSTTSTFQRPPTNLTQPPPRTSHNTPPSFGAPPGAHYSRNPWQYSSLLKGREDRTSSSSSPQSTTSTFQRPPTNLTQPPHTSFIPLGGASSSSFQTTTPTLHNPPMSLAQPPGTSHNTPPGWFSARYPFDPTRSMATSPPYGRTFLSGSVQATTPTLQDPPMNLIQPPRTSPRTPPGWFNARYPFDPTKSMATSPPYGRTPSSSSLQAETSTFQRPPINLTQPPRTSFSPPVPTSLSSPRVGPAPSRGLPLTFDSRSPTQTTAMQPPPPPYYAPPPPPQYASHYPQHYASSPTPRTQHPSSSVLVVPETRSPESPDPLSINQTTTLQGRSRPRSTPELQGQDQTQGGNGESSRGRGRRHGY